MEEKKQKKHQLSTTQLILLGFLAAVLAGPAVNLLCGLLPRQMAG